MILEAASKAVLYAAALTAFGAAIAIAIVLASSDPPIVLAHAQAGSQLRLVGLSASMAAVVALGLRAWTHTLSAFGWPDAASLDALATVAWRSRWGHSWQLQLTAALVATLAFAAARKSVARIPVLVASLALALALPLTGHASGERDRLVIHVTHVVSASAWVGTLASLAFVRRRWAPAVQAAVFKRFSPIALVSASALGASGVVAAVIYVGTIGNLVSTDYGRILIVKLALIAGVAACGFFNWRGIRAGSDRPAAAIAFELVFAAGVVLATAVLTETGHP